MHKKQIQISAFLISTLLLFVFTRCSAPRNQGPHAPSITFNGYEVQDHYDTAGSKYHNITLRIGFTDGDGDLGLDQSDTFPPFNSAGKYHFNIIVNYFEKIGGKFIQLTQDYPFSNRDTIRFNGRFPVLTPDGKHKAIEGEISYTLYHVIPFAGNRIKLLVYIYDRALHKSNEVESPEIVLN